VMTLIVASVAVYFVIKSRSRVNVEINYVKSMSSHAAAQREISFLVALIYYSVSR